VGAVLIAAIAGAAYFLDWRTRSELTRYERAISGIAGDLTAHGEALRELRTRASESPSRRDVESAFAESGKAIAPLQETVRSLSEKVNAATSQDQRASDEVKKTLEGVALKQAAAEGVLAALGEEVKRIAADVQAVRQMPLASGTFGGGPPRGETAEQAQPKPAEGAAGGAGGESGIAPALTHFVKQLTDPDAGTRWSAVEKLTGSGDKRVVAHLLPVLKDNDPFVRRICAAGLGELGAREAVGGLIDALTDQESIVRDASYRSLRKLTGQNLAFDPEASAEKRAEGVRRWNEWWKTNKESFLAGK
jgi:hypothetical protein